MTTQSDFRAALLDAALPVPPGLLDGQGQPAGRRYAVYRNNVAVSLAEALETAFPAVSKLIGAENFAKAAGLFLRQEPPSSPLMMHYGAGFPEFLASLEPLQSIGYLADVARLEQAMRQSYHAADASVLDPSRLQSLSEDQLMSARLILAPSVRLLRSPWPVLAVYNFTMNDGAQPDAVAQDVLVTRPDYDPVPHLLPSGGADFVSALQNNLTFSDAMAAAGAEFDLGPTLSVLLSGGALSDIIST
ncbi:DNA-binding domain-containing protein [uncultured Pelagimonas sp.]|uniref:HvfC/BufC N-terminal domain-containing protein n=1 Tax=uncultured Pelagimonas sp. TaxID=1618102 RepID=UPI002607827B|nr:DNA-binding domain-containing protein [uncultured Pelagimonas sp.]